MSDTEMKATATLELTQAIAALRSLTDGTKLLQNAVVQLNQAQNQYTNHATKGFKEVGNVVSKIPGLSTLSDVFKEAGNGSTVFARLGVGIAVITAAFKAFEAVSAANVDRMRQMVAVQNEFYQIAEKTKGLADSQAKTGGAQNTKDYRRAFALGGQGALDDATMLEGTGNFTHDESLQAIGTLLARFGKGNQTNEALGGLINGSRVGLSMDEMLKQYTESTMFPGQASFINSQIYNTDRFPGGNGTGPERYQAALARSMGDPYQQASARDAATRADIPGIERGNAIALGARPAHAELAEVVHVGNSLQIEWYRAQERKWAEDRLIANQQNKFFAWMMNSWPALLMGSSGSLNHQLDRNIIQTAHAQGLGDPEPVPFRGLHLSRMGSRVR